MFKTHIVLSSTTYHNKQSGLLHTCLFKLVDEIVLQDGTGRKVITHIHKRGQGSGGEALNPLHGSRRRVSSEREQAAVSGPGWDRLLQHRELVLIRSWRRDAGVKSGEVKLQGVDYEQNNPAETRLDVAKVHGLLSGLQYVSAGAGPVHLQPHQQKAAHEQVDAHKVERTHPEKKGQHWQRLHPRHTGKGKGAAVCEWIKRHIDRNTYLSAKLLNMLHV